MTLQQLIANIEELEAQLNKGIGYSQIEEHTRETLKHLLSVEDTTEQQYPELRCRLLLVLSQALRRSGRANEALLIAEDALAATRRIGNKGLYSKCWNSIGLAYANLSDYIRALEYFNNALALHEELGMSVDAAGVAGNIGNVYVALSNYHRALEYYGKALVTHEELGNKTGIASTMGNIGNVYRNLSDYARALEYYGKALAAHEELGMKTSAAVVIGNIGIMYYSLSNFPLALEYYGKALAAHEALNNKADAARGTGNIGSVYLALSDYPKALEYMEQSLASYKELGMKQDAALVIGNIGQVYANEEFEGYSRTKAEEHLLTSLSALVELGVKKDLYEAHRALADFYKKEERWKECQFHFEKYHNIEKEVQSEEVRKQAEQLDYERKTAEREKQVALLRERESILNNILPDEITTRLINGENPIADTFDCATILFMDIVDFTVLSSKISAQQLVHLLNAIFTAADGVIREFSLEKIKTIGDAYMAVAGVPVVQTDHAERAAQAAQKLLDVMKDLIVTFPDELGDRSWIESLPEIQVRIGLHCGPVAAGVVGENKFLYDLWGDAVNTASRMESHGEAGKIHVSEEFVHQLAVDIEETTTRETETNRILTFANCPLSIIPRGELEIKGKGLMKTFFLEKAS